MALRECCCACDEHPVSNRTLYQAEPRPDTLHAYRFSLSALGSSVPNRGRIYSVT
jgi:hypothetical protein